MPYRLILQKELSPESYRQIESAVTRVGREVRPCDFEERLAKVQRPLAQLAIVTLDTRYDLGLATSRLRMSGDESQEDVDRHGNSVRLCLEIEAMVRMSRIGRDVISRVRALPSRTGLNAALIGMPNDPIRSLKSNLVDKVARNYDLEWEEADDPAISADRIAISLDPYVATLLPQHGSADTVIGMKRRMVSDVTDSVNDHLMSGSENSINGAKVYLDGGLRLVKEPYAE